MSDYLQPDFYRFNQDSLELVRFALERVAGIDSILDLGAGSGVIGIELSIRLKPKILTLVECQEEFFPFLNANKQLIPIDTKPEIVLSRFGSYQPSRKYQLVVCNPPFYLPDRGEASANQHKHICRSFVLESWTELAQCIARSLALTGQCFVVIRKDKEIEKVMSQALEQQGLSFQIEGKDKCNFVSISLIG